MPELTEHQRLALEQLTVGTWFLAGKGTPVLALFELERMRLVECRLNMRRRQLMFRRAE